MAFIPVPATAEVHMSFVYGGQICENVFHVTGGGEFTTVQLTDIAEAFRDWWIGSLINLVPNTLTLDHIEVISLHTESSPGITLSGGTLPAVGTNGSPQLPNNCTVAVKWLTALRGRSFRGRTFHLGLMEGNVTESTLVEPMFSALLGAYDNLPTTIGLAPFVLTVVSRFHNLAPRTQGIATPVQSVALDATVDSQRRRLPGRGS